VARHRAETREDLAPVHAGQHQVQDRHIGPRRGRRGDRLLAVGGRVHIEPLDPEVDLQQAQDRGVVVDEEHARHGLSIRAEVPATGLGEAGC
jgi:hypothetical protein